VPGVTPPTPRDSDLDSLPSRLPSKTAVFIGPIRQLSMQLDHEESSVVSLSLPLPPPTVAALAGPLLLVGSCLLASVLLPRSKSTMLMERFASDVEADATAIPEKWSSTRTRVTGFVACGVLLVFAWCSSSHGRSSASRAEQGARPGRSAELVVTTLPESSWGQQVGISDETLHDDAVAYATEAEHIDVAASVGTTQKEAAATDSGSADHGPPQLEELFRLPLQRQELAVSSGSAGGRPYYRSAYYGTLMVGSPPQPFKAVFDTGSGHLVIPSMFCKSETCKAHSRFSRKRSTTAVDIDHDGTMVLPGQPRDQITVSFGTGEVTGMFIDDVVCLGANTVGGYDSTPEGQASRLAQTGCTRMRFINALEMSEDPFKSFEFDGVLGLGLPGTAQTPEFSLVNVFGNALEAAGPTTRAHIFAVFLGESEEQSEITFGGWDDKHLADDDGVAWQTVLDPDLGHWTLHIQEIRVDDEVVSFCKGDCKAVVDTGTSLVSVPTGAFPELYELLKHPADYAGCQGPGPKLHIVLNGYTLTLEPQDYARHTEAKPRAESGAQGIFRKDPQAPTFFCKPVLMAMDMPAPIGPKLFILGEPVLRKYYSIYDVKNARVGFGRARHSGGQEGSSHAENNEDE